ncbi:hypothetical protein HDV05_005231 [Chytridiales sp. JEL 0842]|nr:hypothetical protein HDV05_005231 [Chytridiales sp. JEL 0842]
MLNFKLLLPTLLLAASTLTASALPSCQYRSSALTPTSPTGLENGSPCTITDLSIGSGGFYIRDGKIYDDTNEPLIMRGLNIPFIWFRSHESMFAEAKARGANTARLVLDSRARLPDVRRALKRTLENKMVAVLENHDTTGFGEKVGSKPLSEVVKWWISMRDALVGQEKYVIINIGNEAVGNVNYTMWIDMTLDAIKEMRAAGFKHTLMLDGPNWAQDWTDTMVNNARRIFDSDPLRNVVFSVHMYGGFKTYDRVESYINRYVADKLPLVIGEFGFFHSDGEVAEQAIYELADKKQIGWLAWSWSGNGEGVDYLDVVNAFDNSKPTEWGQSVFDNFAGAREAAVFGSVDRPAVPANPNPQSLPIALPKTPENPPSKYNETVVRLHIAADTSAPGRSTGFSQLVCKDGLLEGGIYFNFTYSLPKSAHPQIRYPPLRAFGLPQLNVRWYFPLALLPTGPPDLRVFNSWNLDVIKGHSEWAHFRLQNEGQLAGVYGLWGPCEGEPNGPVEMGRIKIDFEKVEDVEGPGLPEGYNGLPAVLGPVAGNVEIVNEFPKEAVFVKGVDDVPPGLRRRSVVKA